MTFILSFEKISQPILKLRGGPTAWPPRSSDLNALGFYLSGHLRTLVYAAPVDTEEALHHRIVDACHTICS
jgi:hypothetical protein